MNLSRGAGVGFYSYPEAARIIKGRVVLDPERSFGKPIDAEAGVPTRALCDAALAGGGQSPAVVAEWFGVPLEAVQAAVAFEGSLLAA
jgi:uncharacterized protein (DUF433 family)